MCKNWREKGNCRYGDRCLFAHGTDELTKASVEPKIDKEYNTPKKNCEVDQIASESTQENSDAKLIFRDESPLEFVLSGEIDDLLNRDIHKTYAPNSNLAASISEIARQVSPLNILYTGQ